jgi:hypothetical protein
MLFENAIKAYLTVILKLLSKSRALIGHICFPNSYYCQSLIHTDTPSQRTSVDYILTSLIRFLLKVYMKVLCYQLLTTNTEMWGIPRSNNYIRWVSCITLVTSDFKYFIDRLDDLSVKTKTCSCS